MADLLTFTIDLINGTHNLPTNNFVSFQDVPVDTNNDVYKGTVEDFNIALGTVVQRRSPTTQTLATLKFYQL